LKNGGSVCGCRTCGDGAIWFNFANWIDYDGLASRRVIVKSATEPSGILSKWWKKVLAIYDEEEFGREFTQMHANERQGNDASRSDFPGGGYGTTERACFIARRAPPGEDKTKKERVTENRISEFSGSACQSTTTGRKEPTTHARGESRC
jgi:hypothetical protein